MSSRCNSGKNSPAKLMDTADDIKRRKDLAERKMRERHQLIKKEHNDKLRKDLEEYARLQRELKEKEARDLRRQQEIIQKNIERLNRDEQRRKELLAKNHAATSRTAAIRNVAFGSSTPRELSYLDKLPKSQKAYDKKLSPPPPKESELKSAKSTPAARRGTNLMVSSMYVPSTSPRTKPAPTVSRTSTPKMVNLMTQSFYSARTTSSAGALRPSPQQKPKLTTSRPSTRASVANDSGVVSGKPPVPTTPLRRPPINKTTASEKTKSVVSRVKEEKKDLPIPSTIPETASPAELNSQNNAGEAEERKNTENLIEISESLPLIETTPVISVMADNFNIKPVKKEEPIEEDNIMKVAEEEKNQEEHATEDFSSVNQLEEIKSVTSAFDNLLLQDSSIHTAAEEAPSLAAELDGLLSGDIPQLSENHHLYENNHNKIEEAHSMSLADELSGVQNNSLEKIEHTNTDLIIVSEEITATDLPASNDPQVVEIDYEQFAEKETTPAEPRIPVEETASISVGSNSSPETQQKCLSTQEQSLASELHDLEISPETLVESNVLSIANQAFDFAHHVNPTEFTPIKEHPTSVVGVNDNALSSSESTNQNNNISDSLQEIEKERSTQEKPEVLPEVDQVKNSSLPPSPPIQLKSKEQTVGSGSEEETKDDKDDQKKEPDVRARLAAVLSKTREGRVSPTEKPVVAEVAPTASAPVKFSASTAALLQRLKDSGRASDKLSNLITRHGSDSTLEENPEDPRPVNEGVLN